MFKLTFVPFVTLSMIFLSSCSSLNSAQDRELKELRAKNLEVKEKNPTTAAVLNILPGFGDFYNGNPGYGVANLLLWPISVLWAPVGGATGAEEVNYYSSKAHVSELESKRNKLKNDIELEFAAERISKKEFYIAVKKVEGIPLNEFSKEIHLRDIIPVNYQELSERVPSSTER